VHEPADDALLVLLGLVEVELGVGYAHADLGERLARILEAVRRLHPRLRGDAADRDAGTADAILLDQDDVRAQLCRPDGGRVAARPSAQDGDVTLHRLAPRSLSR